MTIRLPEVDFLSVVHGDHASIWHSYGDIASQILDACTWTQKERRKNGKKKRKGRERKIIEGKRKRKGIGKGKGKEKGKGKRKGKGEEKRNGK